MMRHLPEVLDGFSEPLANVSLRLPVENGSGLGDVRLAAARVVNSGRLVHYLGAGGHNVTNELGELQAEA
jgi:hypothetical protein